MSKINIKVKSKVKSKVKHHRNQKPVEIEVDVKKSVLKGRTLPLLGVKECRKIWSCDNAEAHLSHTIFSHCCDSPYVAHYSKGEIILMCVACAEPEYRIQVASSIPGHFAEDVA